MIKGKRNKSALSPLLLGVALVSGLVTGHLANAYTGEEMAKDANITVDQARAIAVKATPGVVTDSELEKEPGGSGLRYSFDIKKGNKTYEVGVDAQTGKVLENAVEGKNPD